MASFLQNVQKTVAHSSRLSGIGSGSLAGLGDVIASEKSLASAAERYSENVRKSAECLRAWGAGDLGEDLHDILSKVSFLFEQLSAAERKYTEHIAGFRIAFKNLRTREEDYIELQKRKSSLQNKIDAADKQMQKTSLEHKERGQRLQRLEDLRNEMSALDYQVTVEEAKLGDFRRTTVRESLGIKLGGMLELAEKTTIIGEMCKLLVAEVPRDVTQPGYPRADYHGREETARVMDEANRCLHGITFNGDDLPSANDTDGADTSNDGFPSHRAGYTPDQSSQNLGQSTSSAVPPSLGFTPRPAPRERVASNDRISNKARQAASRSYSYQSIGRSSVGQTEPVIPAVVPENLAQQVTSRDYAAAPNASPELLQADPYGGYRSDRQSFPLSVHENRSSLAYDNVAVEEPVQQSQPVASSRAPAAEPAPYYAEPPARPSRNSRPPSGAAATPPRTPAVPAQNEYPSYAYEDAPPTPPAPVTAAQSNSKGSSPVIVQPPQMPSAQDAMSSARSPPQSPRPPNERGNSALGSRHGFDAPVYGQTNNPPPPTTQRFTPAPVAPASGYSYHRANDTSAKLTAGAFRRAANSSQNGAPYSPTVPASNSPSAQIRDAYLARSYLEAPPLLAEPPQQAPEQVETDTAPLRLGRRSVEMSLPPSGSGRATPTGSGRATPVQAVEHVAPPYDPRSYPLAPAMQTSGSGFQANKFVTRLE